MQADSSVRELIISTATRLFLSQGYNQTGINQIIEEAGVAKASLYYHFPSKEDLGVAYLIKRGEKWFGGLEEFLKEAKDPRERLIGVFEYRAVYLEQNDFTGCSYTRILSELPQRGTKLNNQAVANKERQRKYFMDLVGQLDCIPEEKKQDVANTVFLLFDGGTLQCQVYRETRPMEHARKAVIELLRCAGK
ncbi:TetR/AcrR family transcriptional regulator [Dinghuibacter silviterrae]|uniref:TetR family transcriptional regulator n=1 Tax=Dinghuibacter silviterrae TaxID=1539049 RepID=A0A4R8DSY5_9BACT|nr:TetR/AcrR family transcriptional regulator [Dinghuibacter silviterrae]TDX01199.1 TetR family transcriptional regulator [Dinghuibacter silviterrae]